MGWHIGQMNFWWGTVGAERWKCLEWGVVTLSKKEPVGRWQFRDTWEPGNGAKRGRKTCKIGRCGVRTGELCPHHEVWLSKKKKKSSNTFHEWSIRLYSRVEMEITSVAFYLFCFSQERVLFYLFVYLFIDWISKVYLSLFLLEFRDI